MKRPTYFWLVLIGLISAFAADAAAPSLTVQVPGGDEMAIALPAGWTHAVDRPPAGIPPTVDITAPGGTFVKITFMQDPKGQFSKSDKLDKQVTKANQQYVSNSVEKRVVLQRLASKSGPGVYSVFTDPKLVSVAKPPAGEFRNVSSGALSAGRQVLIFAVRSNSTDSDEYKQALDFLTKGITPVAGDA